jgi:hypothetical protein
MIDIVSCCNHTRAVAGTAILGQIGPPDQTGKRVSDENDPWSDQTAAVEGTPELVEGEDSGRVYRRSGGPVAHVETLKGRFERADIEDVALGFHNAHDEGSEGVHHDRIDRQVGAGAGTYQSSLRFDDGHQNRNRRGGRRGSPGTNSPERTQWS